ncbi:MAG TPA: TetR/AcrR family transcriptional regulator [Myxococcota bacterium]|nr:TetR/AcrR family transcriptional regulator [Myxococcota bacterium]
MPKVVDRERRRGDLAGAAARVIARIGLEGVTVQSVAAEANCSAGSIAHYFRNKDELLLHALRASTEPLMHALREPGARASTIESLRAIARDSLPLDATRERDWRVRLAFWTRASGPPEEVQLARQQLAEWRVLWEGAIRALQSAGAIRRDADPAESSSGLVALILGAATHLLVRPRNGARPAEAVDSYLRALGR